MVFKLSDNILSPLGETTAENYQAVKAGRSLLRRYEHAHHIPEPFAASLFTDEQNQVMAEEGLTRFESLVCRSARRAIASAGIDSSGKNVVLILSTTKGNIELIADGKTDEQLLYPCTAAEHIARELGVTTQPVTVCNACISGVSALVLALRLLEAGTYDYAIVCGADTQCQFTISGFQSLKAVSEEACKPFDIERRGLNLGEAAATIVLSAKAVDKGWAIARGAVRNDGFHISSPSKNGEGARLTLEAVMKGYDAESLAFVNAHGTATMFNDQMESVAISRAGLQSVPVNAYKGYFGHTLGAAGILETILSMAAADDHTILATRGFEEMGVSGKINVCAENMPTQKHSFVKMISGFGGCNGAVLVARDVQKLGFQDGELSLQAPSVGKTVLKQSHHIRLTASALEIDGRPIVCEGKGKALLTALYKQYVNDYPKFYKMDGLSRLGFIASELLLQAEGQRMETPREDRAVVLFNHTSSIQADKVYQASIQDEQDYFPSPAAFVYTLPNIVAGEIAIRNQYHGETSFYILPEKDGQMMTRILTATFGDTATESILGGWIDYQDDHHFEADIYIVDKQ